MINSGKGMLRMGCVLILLVALFRFDSLTPDGDSNNGTVMAQRVLHGRVKPVGVYTLTLPDYHHSTPDVWKKRRNDVYSQLCHVADELLERVADPRLGIDERVDALWLARRFEASFTAPRLVVIIDLENQNSFDFSGTYYGRYPVVSALSEYGSRVVPYIVAALVKERNEVRRRLLCDVLEGAVGLDQASEAISAGISDNARKHEERENLLLAVSDIERRRQSRK